MRHATALLSPERTWTSEWRPRRPARSCAGGLPTVIHHDAQHHRQKRHQHGRHVQRQSLCAPQDGHRCQQRQAVLLWGVLKDWHSCSADNVPLVSRRSIVFVAQTATRMTLYWLSLSSGMHGLRSDDRREGGASVLTQKDSKCYGCQKDHEILSVALKPGRQAWRKVLYGC